MQKPSSSKKISIKLTKPPKSKSNNPKKTSDENDKTYAEDSISYTDEVANSLPLDLALTILFTVVISVIFCTRKTINSYLFLQNDLDEAMDGWLYLRDMGSETTKSFFISLAFAGFTTGFYDVIDKTSRDANIKKHQLKKDKKIN